MKTVLLVFFLASPGPAAFSLDLDFDGARTAASPPVKTAGTVPPEPARRDFPLKEWTVMVYLNGKNDLESFALADLNEMETAGSSAEVNIVAEAGRMRGYDDSEGDWTGVRRYLIEKDTNTYRVSSPVIEDLGMADMGSYLTLGEFGRWAKANYPAKKYALIVWNHGSGWLARRGGTRGISYDSESGSHITIPRLRQALEEIGHVDILGFDACLMQMAEVAYEIRASADYVAASEETEPADGYPYDRLLARLAAKPDMPAAELGGAIVDAYAAFYDKEGEASTQSLIKTSSLADLPALAKKFTAAVMAAAPPAAVRTALKKALVYAVPQNADLYDAVASVTESSRDPAVLSSGRALMTHIEKGLVLKNRFTNAYSTGNSHHDGNWFNAKDYSRSSGLAAYLPGLAPYSPGNAFDPAYLDLAWAADSAWPAFISWYLK